MSALQQYIKRPEPYLVLVLIVIVFLIIDIFFRAPENQVTSRLYINTVHTYQNFGRPILKDKVVCKFNESCSEYSIIVTREHGLFNGLKMTYARISSCKPDTD